jgi:hypothetical protein
MTSRGFLNHLAGVWLLIGWSANKVVALEKRVASEAGEEAAWSVAEIERKREEMAFAMKVLDILSPPSVSSGSAIITSSRDTKSNKDKKVCVVSCRVVSCRVVCVH